jgi:hypothetical protein
MRFRLDDNSQEAFQFLAIGAGMVLLARLAFWGVDRMVGGHASDALEVAIEATRNGFLLPRNTLVVGASELTGRLAMAALLTLITASLAAAVGGAVAALLGASRTRAAVRSARWALLLAGAWCLYAVLFLPPASTRIDADGLVLTERRMLLGEIAWPLSARSRTLPWHEVDLLQPRSVSTAMHGCGSMEELVLHTQEERLVVARIIPSGGNCADDRAMASMRMEQLASGLKAHFEGVR